MERAAGLRRPKAYGYEIDWPPEFGDDAAREIADREALAAAGGPKSMEVATILADLVLNVLRYPTRST